MSNLPTITEVGGLLIVEWPSPRPESVDITAEALEDLVGLVNRARLGLEED